MCDIGKNLHIRIQASEGGGCIVSLGKCKNCAIMLLKIAVANETAAL